MKPVRILIADDHKDFRSVVERFLRNLPSVMVVGEASDGVEVVEKVEELKPDLVLMDIAMPQRSGLEATRIIKHQWPGVQVIITTMYDYPIYRMQAQEVHADQFVLKSALKSNLESVLGIPPNGTKTEEFVPPLIK
ncbi:MAG: response regulator transcription factor [bacterium]